MQDKAWTDSEELDKLFDDGDKDVLHYFDTDHVEHPGQKARSVVVDLPIPVYDALERESGRTGTPVQNLIESWVQEKVGLAA
ncbi:MAG: hypothetical protein FWF43_00250 [Propionibacteriaceae bacterium]|nr:hypothetical protein [Propionibacteriaceae bacterium]